MHRFLYSLIILFLAQACNESSQTNTSEDTITKNEKLPVANTLNVSGCYMRVLKRDTMAISLQQGGDKIMGKLTFDNYQKDGSTGTVNGTVEDGLVKLIYSFRSEGMNSVMQVYFKIANGGLIHGLGPVTYRGDTVYYANPAAVSFNEENKLISLPCEQLPAKYK